MSFDMGERKQGTMVEENSLTQSMLVRLENLFSNVSSENIVDRIEIEGRENGLKATRENILMLCANNRLKRAF